MKMEEIRENNKKPQANEDLSQSAAWLSVELSRHPARPYTQDYLDSMFSSWTEIKGDRLFREDKSLIAGVGTLRPSKAFPEGKSVVFVGHQKGRKTKEKIERNFGMPHPEGYRKAQRAYEFAERFGLPLITFVDTPGAYPGIGAEERGQSEAIARNLYVMAELKTPIIGVIIGEGGSGGALALGVVDQLLILQYSTYSVISPEGCASILWKSADKASVAAETLGITAPRLKAAGLVDRIVDEPLGGAHRNQEAMMQSLRKALAEEVRALETKSMEALLEQRYARLMSYGQFKEVPVK
jgi:acetyl-CoA carboxylase carboxyl transferase subunit alpha